MSETLSRIHRDAMEGMAHQAASFAERTGEEARKHSAESLVLALGYTEAAAAVLRLALELLPKAIEEGEAERAHWEAEKARWAKERA